MTRPRPTAPDVLQKILDSLTRETPTPRPADVERKPRVIASRKPPRAPAAEWFNVEKKCAHCGKVKNVGRDFGTTPRRGVEYANGWCKACRASTNYHDRPRKNHTKHNP